jgi:FkbH-like protein
VQHELVSMEQSGVLLCLCSKNNPGDVEAVLEGHPSRVLRSHHFAMKQINWKDKVSNLRSIARELNLGLDSFVFLDDSNFECEAVRAQLPGVRVFQVPARLSDYPRVIEEIKELFLAGGISQDSRSKTEHYRHLAQAGALKAEFDSEEAYLASLGLMVGISVDAKASLARISELTMKSNQFNLTTRRYGEVDILNYMESPESTVYSIGVRDKFGDAGLTGILIIQWQSPVARVDTFLLSCRIIGRGIEHAVWHPVIEEAARRGCRILAGEYIPTLKNQSVVDFYQQLGLTLVEEALDGARRYQGEIGSITIPETPWIEVTDGR